MSQLAGVRVLETGAGIASAYAAKLLRDLGAEVLLAPRPATASEPPEPVRRYHAALNAFLDEGKTAFSASTALGEIAATADVVVTAEPLPMLAERGLEPAALADAGKV